MPMLGAVAAGVRGVVVADACRAGAASALRQAAVRVRRRGGAAEDTVAAYVLDVARGVRRESALVALVAALRAPPAARRDEIARRVLQILAGLALQPPLLRRAAAWLACALRLAPPSEAKL